MKGNKKILAVALLLLLVAVSFGTYAIYKSSATGTSSVKAANWAITVNEADIVEEETFTVGDITWTTHNGKNNTIAPGDKGTITITIHNGAEVDVNYAVTIGSITGTPLTVTAATGSTLTGGIAYQGADATITLDVEWATEDTTAQNETDLGYADHTLAVPVTVTVSQANFS